MSDVLQAALRESPVLMAVVDDDLVCRELSPAWRDLLSIARNTPVSLDAAELFDAVDQVRITARIRFAASDGRAVRGLMGTLSTTGRPMLVRLWAWRTVSAGDGAAWTVITAFETIRAHAGGDTGVRSMHQRILEAAGEGICGVDDLGRITFMNGEALSILSGKAEELIGQPLHDVVQHSKADGSPYAREDSPIRAAYKEGESSRVDDEVFWRMDGNALAVEYTCAPIWNKERLAGAVVVFKDISTVRRLESEQHQARAEIEQLRQSLDLERSLVSERMAQGAEDNEPLIVESRAMRRTMERVHAIAAIDTNVLIVGERGVGKAALTRAIHASSTRHAKPLVAVKCARLEQAQTQLFGPAERVPSDEPPVLRVAENATLVLENVEGLSLDLQLQLLQALESATPKNGNSENRARVRVLATSSHDLESAVHAGRFNEALYDKISVFSVHVPPLRQRPEDIAPLAQHFLQRICEKLGQREVSLTRQQLMQLKAHDWSGNVQELRGVLEHALIVSTSDRLRLETALPPARPNRPTIETSPALPQQIRTEDEMRAIERANMLAALRHCRGRVSGPDGAAVLLGLKPSTLAYRMKNFGIKKEDIRGPRARLGECSSRLPPIHGPSAAARQQS